MKGHRSILIIRLSSLGDILHTLPAFHSLRSAYPEARIDWLVERRLAFLLKAVDGISEVLSVDTRALRSNPARRESWQLLLQPIRTARLRQYDAAIDFQGLLKTAVLALFSGADTRIGFSKELVRERPAHWFYHQKLNRPAAPMHVARLNLLLAQKAGAGPGELAARLKSSAEDDLAIGNHLQKERLSEFVVINPGGGWSTKCWSPLSYGMLSARIQNELQLPVVVVTGPGEESLFPRIAEQCGHRPPVHLEVPFLQLIPLFRKARLVVAGDTGPLHLACALGTPVVAIMGPTAPVRNGPWRESDPAVFHRLPCSFCNGRSCPTANECMDIPVSEVFEAVVHRLGRGA